ncbi:unnamed protein product [Adineta steineri]|uniref:Protein kinase domain-containing protein n=1 Tax=Adineta steineri TaxID=433720 RepID=A0A815ECQ3_9BILA|nr:unnamed protein product [Adineta steineri]
MSNESQQARQNKFSKSSRKSYADRDRSNTSSKISSQLPQSSDTHSEQSSANIDHEFFRAITANFASDIDDKQIPSASSILSINPNNKSVSSLKTETSVSKKKIVLTTKPLRTSKKGDKSKQYEEKKSHSTHFDDKYKLPIRNKSTGEQREDQLINLIKEYHECFEFDQNSNINYIPDNQITEDKRKQYSTALWYELKTYFNGNNLLDENGIKIEQHSIDRQRRKSLDEFYKYFSQCDFEQFNYHNIPTIQRRHLCEYYLNHCNEVEQYMQNIFLKWDYILSLFPSYSALEQYDKRFNPSTREGGIFYEKLFIFQAWFNLYSEINRLMNTLGRIMTCTQCYMWPHHTNLSSAKSNDNITRPQTPSSTSSNEQKDTIVGSPPNPLSFLTTLDARTRRQNTLTSMSSMDSLYQHSLTSGSSLTEYYYRYIDDQVTHARLELIGSIFRSKHGPLLQRLRYTYRKKHRISSTTFDDILNSFPYFPANIIPNDYLLDAKPDKLIDEFFILNKQLQKYKNPNSTNKTTIKSQGIYSDKVNNILNRFDQNPTLTSSTFTPAPAPTLVLKLLSHDRSILKRQSYFLDYLDSTSYPHLPGSTLFPDPCLFLENSPLNFYSQSTSDENILIAKMLTICHRLYDKHVWVDSGRFSDMCDIFRLPSLYPQYVFLVQIPLDLMIAWQKYHHDKKMEQTPTTGALLLLIDECKILIHSATLIHHYIKLMITDTFEKAELKLIEDEFIQFDQNIIDTIYEILTYIERYIEISLRSNLYHNCIMLLKDQWKSLKKYSTMMNIEEILGEKFLNMYSNIIEHFHKYIDVFHSSVSSSETIKIEHIKKKMNRKYEKKLTMNILREAKTIYDDCALTINIYLQKPVCKRFLLILKAAGFERIKFDSENHHHHHRPNQTKKDGSPLSKCLLFAPAEYFEDIPTKIQLMRTLSSSFRINTNNNSSTELNDDQSPLQQQQQQQQQQSPTSTQQPSLSISESSPPLVYILCIPISVELESEWRGITHIIPENKILTSILPLHTHWKTTTIFLLTQQTNNLEKFEESFKERLSKVNVQQSDLYNFNTKTKQLLQKRSCFEKIDNSMRNLAHTILSLSNCIANNVEKFEYIIEKSNTRDYVHTEERAFAFGMDIIRETSFYATQCEYDTLKCQAERQLLFANIWLNFVRKKKSITTSKYSIPIPMWLLPGIHFLRHICSLQFTNQIDNNLFSKFYNNMKTTIKYLNHFNENNNRNLYNIQSKTLKYSSVTKHGYNRRQKNKIRLNRIDQLNRMDKRIDRQRLEEGLIGKIQRDTKTLALSKKMEDELACLKIRDFHKLNLLSRGQFATTYQCRVTRDDKKEIILCYKQYIIQHNDTSAIAKVLEQLIPLIHIDHENLIKYHGIALEHDHVLFFMDYCSYGTIAQLLLGTSLPSSSHLEPRHSSISLTGSIHETSYVDKGIIRTETGNIVFQEFLVQRYLRQLLSALSCLHNKEIIHRDIRNVNIFLTDSTKQSIKLGDVNFVYDFKFMQKQSSLLNVEDVINIRESIVFYAPETITLNETTTKSDIWSLGCTVIHMLTGRIPWSNPKIASSVYYLKILNWIANGVHPSIPNDLNLSNECIDFLKQCFQHDPNRRSSSHQLLEHAFIKEYSNND